MASGIAVSEKCAEGFKELNKRGCSVVVMKIDPVTPNEVFLDKKFPPVGDDPEASWKEFLKSLSDTEGRIIIADFQYKETPTVTKSKITTILWNPDNSSIRSKMLYATSMEAVASGMATDERIEAHDIDDLEYKTVTQKVFKA